MKRGKTGDINDSKLKESIIIDRINSGEKELYEILIRRNNQKLYRVVRSYLNNSMEIEDIMQNTYLKAYENLPKFKSNSLFSTWLIRIGINEALARIRERSKIHQVETVVYPRMNSILEIPDVEQPNPETHIINKEARILLERLLDSLDSKYRVVYIMREIEGMPVKEIAACLDLSKSNVKVRLHRAKSFMKERFTMVAKQKEIFEYGGGHCDRLTEKVMSML
ncbi:RNA polymerase sigma factor [Flagellimonas sp.]|uniref:RNA polymerase sigma factor n=1 Tax=Flagellimonas sp. TaxID=2058762 RepID=UPI003C7C7A4C